MTIDLDRFRALSADNPSGNEGKLLVYDETTGNWTIVDIDEQALVSDVDAALSDLANRVGAVEAVAAMQDDQIDAAKAELQVKIDKNGSDITALQSSAGALLGAVYSQDGRLTSNTTRITNLEGNDATQTTKLSNHEGRIATLEGGAAAPPVPPETTITSAPPGSTTNRTPTFTFVSSPAAGATFQVSVDQGTPSWGNPSSGAGGTTHTPPSNLAYGDWYFRVRATVGGNQDATPAVQQFTVVAAPAPDTVIDTYPTNPTYTLRPTFTFHSSIPAGATFKVSVDQGTPNWIDPSTGAAGLSHQPASNLTQGFWTFRVKAIVGGVEDPIPATYAFAVITTATNWKWDAQAVGVLDANSAARITEFLTYAKVNPNITACGPQAGSTYGPTVVYATANDALVSVSGPAPANTALLDALIRVPLGARPATGSDRHFVIVDTTQSPYRIHEFWQANYDNALGRVATCSAGCSYSMNADGTYPTNEGTGWTANAANLPLLAGAIWPSEVQAGVINHALHFGCPQIGQGSTVWPATANKATALPDGTFSQTHLREAHWMRLKSSYNVAGSSLPAFEKIIAKAIQDYGMFLRDNSGSLSIYCVDMRNADLNADQPGTTSDWVSVLGGLGKTISATTNSVILSAGFPWDQMELLQSPPH